ncbi:hypothetical protein [Massilia sp. TS11]|uniref:hypothetical protein n=1 Tax=Massilia sp. TS11 TaxID=2908003 RepID=UPI001EDB220B|nr:hypothetical protein [Massilia sp. TS11]MCG2585376.1 hypothetical protein [Massilia sp. TS11]
MHPNPTSHAQILAARREVLVTQCALQRIMIVTETQALLEPLQPSGWRRYLGPRMQVPLTIAGVLLGLAVSRPKGVLPLMRSALGIFGLLRSVLPMLRK